MFYEEYHNGTGWGVRGVTYINGRLVDSEHVDYYGEGLDNRIKAIVKAKELNKEDAKINAEPFDLAAGE